MLSISITVIVFTCVTLGYCETCVTTGTTPCVTTGTTPAQKGTPNTTCVFPFIYKNETFNGCTRDKIKKGKFWCSTQVDLETNEHVMDNWGFCPSGCDKSCAGDQTCEHKADCPEVNSEIKKFKALSKNAPEKHELGLKLKSLVCNKKTKKFCCPISSKMPCSDAQTETEQQKSLYPHSCQTEPTTNFKGNLLPTTGSCGLSCNTDARVVKGEDAKLGEFPWAALLGYLFTRRKFDFGMNKYVPETYIKYNCGGTLINTWYVLTAAHCHGERKSRSVQQVVLGEWEVSDQAFKNKDPDCTEGGKTCLPKVQKILVDKVILHNDYSKTRHGVFKDIALIRLKTEAVLNAAVQMACLPLNIVTMAAELHINGFGNGLGGYEGTVVGWGHTQNYDDGDVEKSAVPKAILQKAKLPLWSIEGCQENWGEDTISSDQLCAGGGADGADSCKGDSGGGIFIRKNTTDHLAEQLYGYVQVGLVSYGSTTCGNGSPGVFTRISTYIDWIYQHMEI